MITIVDKKAEKIIGVLGVPSVRAKYINQVASDIYHTKRQGDIVGDWDRICKKAKVSTVNETALAVYFYTRIMDRHNMMGDILHGLIKA